MRGYWEVSDPPRIITVECIMPLLIMIIIIILGVCVCVCVWGLGCVSQDPPVEEARVSGLDGVPLWR